MSNYLKKIINKAVKSTLIFTLIFAWLFQIPLSSNTQNWFQFGNFPPRTNQANAAEIAQYTGGIVVYADTTNVGVPKYKIFDDTNGFGSEQNATAVGSAIEWIRVAASPTEDKWIIVTRSADDKIVAQTCTGANDAISCGATTTISATAGTHGFRNYDVAFEGLTGDALIVYGTATADELRKVEWIATSSSWLYDASITTTRTSGTVEWVELTSRSTSTDQIGIAYSDTNDDVSAYRWSGTAVGDEASGAITTTASIRDVRKFDISFEGSSGDMVVAAPIQNAGTTAYGHMTSAGTWAIFANTQPDNITDFIDLSEPMVGDDEVSMIAFSASTTVGTAEGYATDGTTPTSVTTGITDGIIAVDTTAARAGVTAMPAATAYLSSTYYAVAAFADLTGTDDINWWTMNSAGTWTVQADNTRTRATSTFLRMYDYPNANKVILFSQDSASDLWADTWDGAATGTSVWIDRTSGGAIVTSLSSATTNVFDFAFRLAPIVVQVPGIPVFYDSDGTNQISFNNIRQSTTTPLFRISATSSSNIDRFQIEVSTSSSFSVSTSSQTFSGTYASGTAYNLYASSLSPSLPTTDGVTYYVRVRASNNAGTNYGAWSTSTQSFTYKTSGIPDWFQTTDKQFETGVLSTIATGSDKIRVINSGGGGSVNFSATGGATSTSGGYIYHVFNNSGTFTVTSGIGNVEVLVVGGGGGGSSGGATGGGGGGAGGLIYDNIYTVSSSSYTVTVGAGGAGGIRGGTPAYGVTGSTSTFDTLSVAGGGGGMSPTTYGASATTSFGGSGGGGSGYSDNFTGGVGIPGQGNNGGDGYYSTGPLYGGGGGGGSGAIGSNGASATGGNGGVGLDYSSIFGTSVGASGWFAGGGGGAGNTTQGIGQAGGGNGVYGTGTAATANTGSGGGGGTNSNSGGAGGSGIVVIRYPINRNYFTNFSEYATGTQPTGWTQRWATSTTSWIVRDDLTTSGGKVVRVEGVAASNRKFLSWNILDSISADAEIYFKYKVPATTEDAFVAVRGSSVSTTTAVGVRAGFNLPTNGKEIAYYNTSFTRITSSAFTPTVDTWYKARARFVGNTQKYKTWLATDSEPSSWDLETTDGTITAAGWIGLVNFVSNGTSASFADFGVNTVGDTAPTSTNISSGVIGTIMSSPISFNFLASTTASWGQALWSETEVSGSVFVQLYSGSNCSTIIPDVDLAGNSTGFATSPINLSGLSTSTYSTICLKASISDSANSTTLNDWTVNWEPPTASVSSVTQANYRFRNDDGSESTATYAVATNTAITSGIYVGDRKRLRVQLSNTGSITLSNYQYRLEYGSSANSCSTWTAVPSSTTTGPWSMDTTSYISDGLSTTDSTGIANPVGKSFVSGYTYTYSNQTLPISLSTSQFTEIEYSLRSTSNIIPNLAYCFRITNDGDASKFVYSNQPQITVSSITTYRRSGGSAIEGSLTPGANATGGGTGGATGTEQTSTSTKTSTSTPNKGGGGGDVGLLQHINIFMFATVALSGEFIETFWNYLKNIFINIFE